MTLVVHLNCDEVPLFDEQSHTVTDAQEAFHFVDTDHKAGTSGGSLGFNDEDPELITIDESLGSVTSGRLTISAYVYRLEGAGEDLWEFCIGGIATDTQFWELHIQNSSLDGPSITFSDDDHDVAVSYNLPPDTFVQITLWIDGPGYALYAGQSLLMSGECNSIPSDDVIQFYTGDVQDNERIDNVRLYFGELIPPTIDESDAEPGTGIRFPSGIPTPLRNGYSDTFEEHRSAWQAEVGNARRRRRFRRAPRLFELSWSMNQTEYADFDRWYQNDIRAGELPFDIQVLDDFENLVWYTVESFRPYVYNLSDNGDTEFLVQWTVRALHDSFVTRAAGTDELRGATTVGVIATGALQVYTPIYGSCTVEVTAIGKMRIASLRGATSVGVRTATGRLITA